MAPELYHIFLKTVMLFSRPIENSVLDNSEENPADVITRFNYLNERKTICIIMVHYS